MKAKATVVIFCAMLFGLTALNLLAPDREMSESENRYLAKIPAFSWSSLVEGKFTSAFETYLTDQFIWRDGWVGAKTEAELLIGRRSSKGVYFAEDDYLIETFGEVDFDAYRRNLGYVAEFSREAEALGVPVWTMLVPTASGILSEKLPPYAPEPDQDALLREAVSMLPHTVNVMDALWANREEYLFYRTDHHWTSRGAFHAYNAWREARGLPARGAGEYTVEVLSRDFYGTVWSKARLSTTPPDTMEAWIMETGALRVDYNSGQSVSDSLYEKSYLAEKDKYSVYLNANQPIVHITTGAEGGRKLLIVKDSYANAFVQMLLADYSDIFVVDPRYYRASAIKLMEEKDISEALVLYTLRGFQSDPNVVFLAQPLG